MNATDWLYDLKAKADAATDGEWIDVQKFGKIQDKVADAHGEVLAYTYNVGDSSHIAAANPQTVKRLVAMLEWFARDESCTMVCPMPDDYACKHKRGEDCTHSGTNDCEHCWLQAAYEDTADK
jgi:hypothetical protein